MINAAWKLEATVVHDRETARVINEMHMHHDAKYATLVQMHAITSSKALGP